MREPHKKGVAHHFGSESCAWVRKDAGEALTGVRTVINSLRGLSSNGLNPLHWTSLSAMSPGVRSDCSSSAARSKDDSCACFGIGKDFVRVQRKAEVSANVGKTGGADIPHSPGELHRADEANLRPRDLRRLAARFKNPAIKSNVIRSDELHAKEQVLDSRPQLFERRLFTNMLPRNSVYGGKEERISSGPN